jgi:ribosome-associated heat shock protein Hsp15
MQTGYISHRNGKVHLDGERVKPAKEVKTGQVVHICDCDFEIEVNVLALSNIRKDAPEAALFYAETEASITKRENEKLTGENELSRLDRGLERPAKKQLRDIKKFTGGVY